LFRKGFSCNCFEKNGDLMLLTLYLRKYEAKEVPYEQLPARNLSAAVRKLLQSTTVVNQMSPFWSKM